MLYRLLFALLLRHLDPERAHALARAALRAIRSSAPGRALIRLRRTPDAVLETNALGLRFPTPIGVAAGVDKDAGWPEDLAALGFGFVEVGTITAHPQPGNPQPRVARAVARRAIVNRMGFPNPGAEAVADHLARARRSDRKPILGVNVGKSKVASLEEAPADYRAALGRLAPHADFLVINVSSPNTPGLRDLQAAEMLRPLVGAVRSELKGLGREVPLLVKIAPDLDDEDIERVAALALELELAGIVAVNTTVDRSGIGGASVPFEGGGVSGPPLGPRATEVLRRLRAVTGDALVLVSVGGVESAEDAWQRILAGATLVQVYTALVYHGPGWPRRVNRELAKRVRSAGAASIQELVGREASYERRAASATMR